LVFSSQYSRAAAQTECESDSSKTAHGLETGLKSCDARRHFVKHEKEYSGSPLAN
jgi:hypothetical protein